MCLVVDTNIHRETIRTNLYHKTPKPLVATENLLVFKWIVKKRFGSCYGYDTYVDITPFMGKMVFFDKNGVATLESEMENGFPFTFDIQIEGDVVLYKINKGIHSYRCDNLDTDSPFSPNHNYAIIPKGSLYYIGQEYDVVSDKLIIFDSKKALEDYEKENGKAVVLA